MKKLILPLLSVLISVTLLQAQDSSIVKPKKKEWSKVSLGDRANDHFMFQVGYDGWVSLPDSIRTTGFSRHFNVYVMLDKPFKTDPRWSVGFGVGVGSSHIFLDKMLVDLKGSISKTEVTFQDAAEKDHYKKYKLATVWAEAPIELRFISNPLKSDRSWKGSVGVKIGTMFSGYTRGKNLQSKTGQSVYGEKLIIKEKDRKYLNNIRLAPTVRLGYGNFTVYAAYQVTSLFREGQGPIVRPFSIGLCISGL